MQPIKMQQRDHGTTNQNKMQQSCDQIMQPIGTKHNGHVINHGATNRNKTQQSCDHRSANQEKCNSHVIKCGTAN